MSGIYSCLFFLASFFLFNLVHSTEFVPCFMWSNKRTNERVPALNKISQDIFKEAIQQHRQHNAFIVIFAEPTLSPEDFAQHDQSGVIFSNLANLAKSTKIAYLPYVQNPIKALKHSDATVTEVPLEKMIEGFEIPEADILIVNLNDAKDSENRNAMLKRHDEEIATIYENLEKTHENVLAILTAHHPSWVASEEIVRSRQARSLLQAKEPSASETAGESTKETEVKTRLTPISSTFYNTTNIFLYLRNFTYVYEKVNYNASSFDFDIDTSNNTNYILKATVNGLNHTIEMSWTFINKVGTGYWEMEPKVPATIMNASLTRTELNLTSGASVVVPYKFSYHCGDQVFANNDFKATLKNFQVQIFFDHLPNNTRFNDAYDCVGFTSVPIWSGLFVTTILLIIMTIGITMMMDIRTMDRFDDAKGKTITINAE